ncbi:hypothetical protein ACHAXR_005515 [Thalassiosira sp. AJA248-18]
MTKDPSSSLDQIILRNNSHYHHHHLQQQRRYLSSFHATHPTHQWVDIMGPGQKQNEEGDDNIPITKKKKSSSSSSRKKRKPLRSTIPFIDRIHLKTRGGSGGRGGIAYHRIGAYKKRPCGGHGGSGGSVYIMSDPTLSSLKMAKHHYFGQDGGRGGVSGMNGRNGNDTYVRVPCGVVVRRVLDWDEMEDIYAEEEEENVIGEEEEEEESSVSSSGTDDLEAQSLEGIDVDANYDDDDDNNDVHLSNNANNIETSSDQDEVELDDHDEHLDDLDIDGGEDIDNDNGNHNDENIDGEEEDDFDAYLERLQTSSKRQRRRIQMRGGIIPSDYDDVVDSGVRSEDGMYHWSTPDATTDNMMLDGDQLASTAYDDDYRHPSSRKTVFLADLDQPHASLLVAAGGKAGVGNQAYARRPHFSDMTVNAAKKAIPGEGECTYLELELKLIADVGLVGFPNAGKSSLLSAMSRARPKIASYPFTTLHPLVGSIKYKDGYQIVMADVPGLIDGAAEGRGRGIEFLRHIERTKALVYMVDVAGVDDRDPVNDLKILGKELKEYGSSGIFGENEIMSDDEGEYGEEMRRRRKEIMNRPSLILANKMDLISKEDAGMGRREEILFQLRQTANEVGIVCEDDDVLGLSAGVTGEGLRVLSKRLRRVVKAVE